MIEQSFALSELDRRVSNLIQFATVVEADYPHAKLRVQTGDIITDFLPWITPRAHKDTHWHAPEIGEQVVLLAPSGELAQGVIMPALYQEAYPAPADTADLHRQIYNDGTHLEYDRAAHQLTAHVVPAGQIMLKIGNATLSMVDGKIALQVGATALTLTETGISMTGGGSSIGVDSSGIAAKGTAINLN